MLKEFRVQGYRGFKAEIVWSFVLQATMTLPPML